MNELVSLSSVAEIIMGQSPDSASCNTQGLGMPFLQGCGEFGDKHPLIEKYCTKPAKVAPKDSILISVRAPVGETNIADREICIGRGLGAVVAKNADRQFLYYAILQFKYQLKRISQGSTFEAVNSNDLRTFWLPSFTLPQQRKIARILSTCDAVIAKTEAAIAKYRALKQGLMHDLFTRGIDLGTGRLRPKYEEAPELYEQSELGWIPKEWEVKRLGDLTHQINDGTHFTPTYTEYGVPFLRVTDVQNDEIDVDRLKYISRHEHQILIKRCNPQRGDILYSKNGTIGIPKIVDWDWEFSIFVSLALIKPIHKLISTEYLASLLPEDVIWSQIRSRAKQGTVTNLHLEEVREFAIPLPSKGEQEKISATAQNIKRKLEVEQLYLSKYRQMKAGLMQDLLTPPAAGQDGEVARTEATADESGEEMEEHQLKQTIC